MEKATFYKQAPIQERLISIRGITSVVNLQPAEVTKVDDKCSFKIVERYERFN